MGPLFHVILSSMGWKKMLRIFSCLGIIMLICALLYRPLPAKYKRAQKQPEKKTKLFDFSVWKMKSFVFWVISMSLLFIGYFVPFIHLVSSAIFIIINSYSWIYFNSNSDDAKVFTCVGVSLFHWSETLRDFEILKLMKEPFYRALDLLLVLTFIIYFE